MTQLKNGIKSPIQPSPRVAGNVQDVWSIINAAAATTPNQPVVNMGQGFFGYNPPQFLIDAAKSAVERLDCNQYAPPKGRLRLREAISNAYSPFWGRKLDPETEITITTGANEGFLSCCMAFLQQGDEVLLLEPFFDQYISNIEMAGAKVVSVALQPPKSGMTKTHSAGEWSLDILALKKAITPRTRMLVLNTPHNPLGKIFNHEELKQIADVCVENNILIISDEVYDRLFYVPFSRIATMSPEVERITLTLSSAGKNFYATGWRVGWVMGPPELVSYVTKAHARICYCSPSPLQEAFAIGFEQAEANGFWDECISDMKSKMDMFNEIWHELDMPYSEPEGGYFVVVNMSKVQLPENYDFPTHVINRPRDFKLAWFLIQELGVAAIPPSEFYSPANQHIGEQWMRFASLRYDAEAQSYISPLIGRRDPLDSPHRTAVWN
ncbi:uncharacterized protein Triagg1_3459 [Trichoderma aggressivum f. europaeum]|uniref:Aminotransferase class I/classII large domain-containing protein n=1 Tax=Trichoderma aggressivum f. europaeum TaxID=173218 RepID=A0AAE1IJ00_9HYPO|nr:hypothetical protein Triagg1_3459 [Trichoderma aggressivum f. europaeum]